MQTDPIVTIRAIHDWYRSHVLDVRLTPEWERRWLGWIKQGYTMADLVLVIRYLKTQIRIGKRNPGCLKLSNLLDYDPDQQFARFDEDLAMARADALPPRPRPTAQAQPTAQAAPASDEQRKAWAAELETVRRRLVIGQGVPDEHR